MIAIMCNNCGQFHQRSTHSYADPESEKFQLSHQYIFALLGSAQVKAAQKNDDEIDS